MGGEIPEEYYGFHMGDHVRILISSDEGAPRNRCDVPAYPRNLTLYNAVISDTLPFFTNSPSISFAAMTGYGVKRIVLPPNIHRVATSARLRAKKLQVLYGRANAHPHRKAVVL